MKRCIVFQGDSITDGGRIDEPNEIGFGYVKNVVDWLVDNYKDIVFYNRGIGGNKASDLVERWESDAISLKPDIIIILVGINDAWYEYYEKDKLEFKKSSYEQNYRNILEQCKINKIKIVMMQPFRLKCQPQQKEWELSYLKIKATCDRLAIKFADIYIKLGDLFDKLSIESSPNNYSEDGVHPTENGIKIIADNLIVELSKLLKK